MVGPSLLLLMAVAVVTWTMSRTDGDAPYAAPVPSQPGGATIDAGGAAETLQRLVSAVSSGDSAAARALAAANTATGQRLADLADVAEAARIEDLAFRYIDDKGGFAADGTWAATVDTAWSYAGFDDAPTSTEVTFRFAVSEGGGVVVAGLGGGGSRTPVWMSGPMQVSRSDDLLVVAAPGIDLGAYVRLARSAVPTVSSVVTTWRPRLVVEVPADGAAFEAALGADSGYYAQIAAVTGAGGSLVAGAPIHVYVNPDVYSALGRAGREVVMAHEATHVATTAPFSTAPTWLIEGFADYVALLRTELPLRRTAGQIARQVRDEGLPVALPREENFETRAAKLGAVYESSWQLCVTLAEHRGTVALRNLYFQVSNGSDFATLLRRAFGWSEADLIAAWRDRLSAIATRSE